MPEGSECQGKIAILYDKDAKLSPSNSLAIEKFMQSAKKYNYQADIIHAADVLRLFEYDILFIRDTTVINNYTYDMAKTAENLGLIVIDDPHSISICCDKTKQFELFTKNNIPIPKTFIVTGENITEPRNHLERPYIIKNPYSCFSYGVFMVDAPAQYMRFAWAMLEKLDKIIVQEFVKTDFDWRICLLGNKIIFACKYYMTPGHWKIIKHNSKGEYVDGESTCIPIDKIPPIVSKLAIQTSYCVGNGLYGVDIKQLSYDKAYVIEINDNPNIDAGNEDELLGDELYDIIINYLIRRHQLNHLRQLQDQYYLY